MKFRVKLICLLIAFCVISSATLSTLAQTTTSGAIEGRVYEEGTNLGIAGAVVTIRNQETGLTRTTATDQTGRYFIGTLPPGFYRINAAAQGYVEGLNSSESNFPITITENQARAAASHITQKIGCGCSADNSRDADNSREADESRNACDAAATNSSDFFRAPAGLVGLRAARQLDERVQRRERRPAAVNHPAAPGRAHL